MVFFKQKDFLKIHLGEKGIRSHIDALHAQPPCSDKFTGDIVEGVVSQINCSGIVATVSRKEIDLNRPRNGHNKDAIDEYRQAIRDILSHIGVLEDNGKLSRPYLHIAIHGLSNKWEKDIIIGTKFGQTCSEDVKSWLVGKFKEEKYIKRLCVDEIYPGDSSKSVHRCGDKTSDHSYFGYGENFNTFQIEISRTLREKHQTELIALFCKLIKDFKKRF